MAVLTEDDVAQKRALAELKREDQAARQAAKVAARAARDDEKRRRRAARAQRRVERWAALTEWGCRLRPVAPLLLVTGFAMYAQYDYGLDAYTSPATVFVVKVLVALGAAIALESIANYVQWHAHDALLLGATATAARLRRASYLIAFGIAAVNYSHYSNGWAPTPAAVVFALFSASQPWLWGLHTRRAQRIQLIREGHVDSAGATFSAERWRAFPWQTWQARRWSIDQGVDDPRSAWAGFKMERAARRAEKAAQDRPEPPDPDCTGRRNGDEQDGVGGGSGGPGGGQADAGGVPDRRAVVDVSRDAAVIDDLRALEIAYGRRYKRDHLKAMYGMGSPRAERLLRMIGWFEQAGAGDEQAGAGAR